MTTRDRIMDYTLSSAVGSGVVQNSPVATFRFTHVDANPPAISAPAARFPDVRCDGIGERASGCAVPAAEPILDMRTRNVPTHSAHIDNAQRTGLPGAPGGTPLTRSSDVSRNQNNRNGSCNRIPGPRATGVQCDEYPFAATYQGGAGDGQHEPTTSATSTSHRCTSSSSPSRSTWGLRISMCLINGTDNMRGGGITTWFFAKIESWTENNFVRSRRLTHALHDRRTRWDRRIG